MEIVAMGIEPLIDAWEVVRSGRAPLASFSKAFGDLSFGLEESPDAEVAGLSLDIRLVMAEFGRGDLTEDEAIEEIDKLVPATASRPLRREVAAVADLPRDVPSSDTTTDWTDLIRAGS